MNTLKNLFALLFLALLFGMGCSGSEPDLAGVYVNHGSGEFSIADDTLVIEQVRGKEYLIHRKTGYRQIDERGAAGKRILESEEWQAVYDEGSETMTERSRGRLLSFDRAKGLLKLESSTYQRLN